MKRTELGGIACPPSQSAKKVGCLVAPLPKGIELLSQRLQPLLQGRVVGERLVAGMGKETQFLFISHNKIAMEMAEQLIGVTMQEQGVSRIVAVDMESAVSMADVA